jgi:VIT1/CCC1 family predicted Fe2+/Mn2+ transporter
MWAQLEGKKTYSIVIAGVLGAVAGYLAGELTVAETVTAVLTALGVASLRHGVSTEAKK